MNTYRQYTSSQPFSLELGGELAQLTIAYHTFGQLNAAADNVVWVCHALTANSDVSDWWNGLVGGGKLFDTTQYYIVCANILGSCYGSTHPLSENPITGKPYFHTFPQLTIRDLVNAHDILRKHLKISKIQTLIGGSLGGQQAVEWAIINPEVTEKLILIASNAAHSAWGIAFNETQRMAIEADSTWQKNCADAGLKGLKAARAVALLSYRNYQTYRQSQSDDSDISPSEELKAATYQRYQGQKLVARFDAFSYYRLSQVMDSHNVGRGRGGLVNALQQIKAATLVISIKSDILFPPTEQKFLVRNIADAQYVEIDSLYGHDGFLLENEKLTVCVREFERLYADKHYSFL